MAYRDYICCRDCKAKFVYDGNDSIRNSLEATYGDEDAPSWTVELVCPDCLAKLERNPLTEEEVSNLARTMVKGDKSVNWLCRAIEREHGIVSSQMQHIADLEAALAQSTSKESLQVQPFNPDWDRINALEESLREHMAEIHRLKAIAQPDQEQEPVAFAFYWPPTNTLRRNPAYQLACVPTTAWKDEIPLYTAPPQRKPLTEEEIKNCEQAANVNGALPFERRTFFARAIEKAHGIAE